MNNLLWFVAGAIAYKWWNEQQLAAAAANQPAPTSPVQTLVQQVLGPQLGPYRFPQPTTTQPVCPQGQASNWTMNPQTGQMYWSPCAFTPIVQ